MYPWHAAVAEKSVGTFMESVRSHMLLDRWDEGVLRIGRSELPTKDDFKYYAKEIGGRLRVVPTGIYADMEDPSDYGDGDLKLVVAFLESKVGAGEPHGHFELIQSFLTAARSVEESEMELYGSSGSDTISNVSNDACPPESCPGSCVDGSVPTQSSDGSMVRYEASLTQSRSIGLENLFSDGNTVLDEASLPRQRSVRPDNVFSNEGLLSASQDQEECVSTSPITNVQRHRARENALELTRAHIGRSPFTPIEAGVLDNNSRAKAPTDNLGAFPPEPSPGRCNNGSFPTDSSDGSSVRYEATLTQSRSVGLNNIFSDGGTVFDEASLSRQRSVSLITQKHREEHSPPSLGAIPPDNGHGHAAAVSAADVSIDQGFDMFRDFFRATDHRHTTRRRRAHAQTRGLLSHALPCRRRGGGRVQANRVHHRSITQHMQRK